MGSTQSSLSLADRFDADHGEYFMSGVQAVVRMLLDSRRRDRANGLRTGAFVSGYPGSPLGGLDRELQRQQKLLDELGIVHRPGLNEDLAATAVMGSQVASTFPRATVDGVLGVWYGKAPGLDRSVDALRHAVYGGASARGGAVAVVGDDPASKSSTLPSSSERLLAEIGLPVLFPGNVQEVLDYGAHAIEMSRRSGLWTSLKMVTAVADGTGTAVVGWPRIEPAPSRWTPLDRVNGQQLSPPESNEVEQLLESWLDVARDYGVENRLNRIVVEPMDPWLAIVAAGHTFHVVRDALQTLGLDESGLHRYGVRMVHLGMVHPLDRVTVRSWAQGTSQVLVVEEKRSFVELAIRDACYGGPDTPTIIGKRDAQGAHLVPGHGALDVSRLLEPLRRVLLACIPESALQRSTPSPPTRLVLSTKESRTAFFCSGCPHTTGLRVPEGTTVGAGIGCHGMVKALPEERVGQVATVTQMGGEGAQWVGIEPFVERTPFVQNLGDGTLMHSGYLAIRFAVASGARLTYKILYNGAVAMTGGQDPPGMLSVPDLCRALLAEGVRRIIITTEDRDRYRHVVLPRGVAVRDRTEIVDAQRLLAEEPGVTVLIHDQACAAELRRQRKTGDVATPGHRLVINPRVCEGCGDCGEKSACLSLQPLVTEYGRKTTIQQTSCNLDFSCVTGDCPSFMEVRPARGRTRSSLRRPALPEVPVALPEPQPLLHQSHVAVRLPGVGGTGVVTAAQILGVAAGIDGKQVSGLDQTGISQKAGPVVSELRISDPSDDGDRPDTGVSPAGIDVLVVLDCLVALSPGNLAGLSPTRTFVVGSSSPAPTGAMVVDVTIPYPDNEAMQDEIGRHTRAGDAFWIDAGAVTQALFGDPTTANVFVLGCAYQRGLLPIGAAAIEAAIELNGAAVERNRAAFRWGRCAVAAPERLHQHLAPHPAASTPLAPALEDTIASMGLAGEVEAVVRERTIDLVGYQGTAWAAAYLGGVQRAWAAERRAAPGSRHFTAAVARHLHQVMAYKDEYEVARLLTADEATSLAESVAGPGARVTWMLHPPALRAFGRQSKLAFGPWSRPLMVALRHGRRLRGTPLDLFGYSEVRRQERRLVGEYQQLCGELGARLADLGVEQAARMAALVDMVRGYEQVKLRNLGRYRLELAAAWDQAD